MISVRLIAASILIQTILSSGCSAPQNSSNGINSRVNSDANTATVAANDKDEELEAMIRMPYPSDETLWREETGADQKRKLTAVLRYSSGDTQKLEDQASKSGVPQAVEIEAESWFPPELVAKSQQSGNETIKGKSYPATDFFQTPFTQGRISRIDGTNYFVLELYGN